MTDSDVDDAPAPAGADRADGRLDAELRRLYAKYGTGPVPRRLERLARRLDAARQAAAATHGRAPVKER